MIYSPFDKLMDMHYQQGRQQEFFDSVNACLSQGYVHATHDFFIAAQTIRREDPQDGDPRNHDTWYVHNLLTFRHDVSTYIRGIIPFDLPWIAYNRGFRGEFDFKFFPFDHYMKLLERYGKT